MKALRRFVKGILLQGEASDPSDAANGALWYDSVTNKLKAYIASASRNLVNENQAQPLTNKTIDADANTLSNIENADIKAGAAIDATKIADGTVTSTEFQFINSVTSNVQTQINGKQATGNYITDLTGDVTATGPGSAVATLATVNGNVGSFGSSTSIPSFTVNAKGLITAASGNVVIAPAGTLSGTTLNSSVVTSSLTSVGTITTGVWNGTTIAIANGGTGQTTANAAFNALSPMTTGGDLIYGGASGVGTRLANGTAGQVLQSNGTTTAPTWVTPASSSGPNYDAFANLGLAVTASAGALTIALKQADATTDPASGAGAVYAYFRSATLADGSYIQRQITSALSLVVPSGATLGINATSPDQLGVSLQVYLIDDAGTVRLGVRTVSLDTSLRGSSTAISTGSDSGDVMYSDAATTNKARTLIGMIFFNATGLNGTWVAPAQLRIGSQMLAAHKPRSQASNITATTITTGTSGNWLVGSGNSTTLPPGIYEIMGGVDFNNSGTTPAYTIVAAKWASANGANNTTEPAGPGFSGVGNFNLAQFSYGASNPQMSIQLPTAIVEITTTTTLFMVCRVTAGTMGNISVSANAQIHKIG